MLAGALVLAPNIGTGARQPAEAQRAQDPLAGAIARVLPTADASEDVAGFYRAHRHAPLWVTDGRVRPEAHTLIAMLAAAAADGLDPKAHDPAPVERAVVAAVRGDPDRLVQAELALSEAFAAYVSDLRRPSEGAVMTYTDPALRDPQVTPTAALEALVRAPHLASHLLAVRRMHPIYEQLRAELAEHRANGGSRAAERLILANMERARALPADPGRRHILVDAAAGRLWLFEDGQSVDTMAVVVGRRSAPTPVMAGVMRYASFNPYWNLPETMVRDELAPRVLREGTGFFAAEDLEILSDWSRAARVVDPAEVDWTAVASGEQPLRVRRRPGPGNILGKVKLMLPNRLGIYLHDTPDKSAFARDVRTLSAGCVRLEDAMRIARRLLGGAAATPPAGWDVRVDLAEPVPVYIVYLTAVVVDGRLVRRPDIYRRDSTLIAELDRAVAD